MLRKYLLIALVVAASRVPLPASLEAQRPVTLNVAGGGSFPLARFRDVESTGWHALVGLGFHWLMQPIGLRLDVAHNRFTAVAAGPDQAVSSATLNFDYRLPMTNSPMSPYLITGAGAYRIECTGTIDCGSATRFGWNAGLGFRLIALRLHLFAESRFHAVNARSGNVRFVPVTLGLSF
jgi:hypothetical protein